MGVYHGGGGEERTKRYVEVVADFSADGELTPLTIVWEDGTRYQIDRVLDRRRAQSLRTGGTGMRYTIRVGGRTTHLYFDDYRGRWFVEAKA